MILNEGGNAIKSSKPIRGDYAERIGLQIINNLKDFGFYCDLLGSTGKKGKEDYSGDIDIAVEASYQETKDDLIRYFRNHIGLDIEIYDNKGLKIVSIGIPYEDETKNVSIVQVDFMFVDSREYAKFMYHSPDFRKNESRVKGLYRTNLLVLIAKNTPLVGEFEKYMNDSEYFTEDDYDGRFAGTLKSYWKFSLSYTNGLSIVHKTFEGKNSPLKNPKTVKEDTVIITRDINDIIKIILGPSASIEDCNSFESLVDFLCSPRYKYKNYGIVPVIFDEFLNDKRQQSDPMAFQYCKDYIDRSLKNKEK